ncbi:hypothetical protein L2E82_27127 [Cichorium intybus]|uniref:Uncharacterized protein n=1 Tax=Cichorium intybus TaxID=13427 RepID=A0ACB9CS92_CICIN|nr:hypothetical protein L2E82_27127 [Cichorium intybus]
MLVQLLMLLPVLTVASIQPKKSETYIIHMDHSRKPDSFPNHESWHQHTVNSLSLTCLEDKEPFLYSYTHGTARGIAPNAHLAMYKVLWSSDSFASAATDILAGMDQAISDGVDVMSLSLGLGHMPYFDDVIAIASLSAIEKGIVVVCAAGNDGPGPGTIYNGAPWIMTVGAGTMDRSFLATLELGNGLTFEGTSYFPASVSITDTPLYFGRDDPITSGCVALNRTEVVGKVVICDNTHLVDIYGQMDVVTAAGAYGAIFLTDSVFLDPEDYPIPGILLHTRYGNEIMEYAWHNTSSFLCDLRYNETQMSAVIRRSQWGCHINATDLNYPSFIASFNQTTALSVKQFTRTVTNVGAPRSTYWASLEVPSGMIVSVEPSTLKFASKHQKHKFVVSIQVERNAPNVNYGYLKWVDERNHTVSSPIVVTRD